MCVNARFNIFSIQQKRHRTLKIGAVSLDVTVSQTIEHSLRWMMEDIAISNGDHSIVGMNCCQQFRRSRGGTAMMRHL